MRFLNAGLTSFDHRFSVVKKSGEQGDKYTNFAPVFRAFSSLRGMGQIIPHYTNTFP